MLDSERGTATMVRVGMTDGAGTRSSALPTDLFDEARGRLRLLATIFAASFGFDFVIFLGSTIWSKTTGQPSPVSIAAIPWINLATLILSIGIRWAAGSRRVPVGRLYSFALAYEVFICFVSALITYWQSYHDTKLLPNLTWAPAIVIMFPLILPGPPKRMIAGAVLSGAMVPLALLVLQLAGAVKVGDGAAYAPAAIGSVFAVVVASMGARVIYGLGREVARVRALGSYQLEEMIGAGGMGEVWRAKHRLLARPAAIKLIRRSSPAEGRVPLTEEVRRRFEREAQAIAGLRSPHTVELFDFGVSNDGEIYYAMELLEGVNADALVRRFGPIPPERAVFLLRQVCHSLTEAESLGMVHRDIKPANIFLCRYGQDHDFVKVLDFGIVKWLREEDTGRLTGEHIIQGTPAFMAPEQAMGDARIDSRADLYALGCVAYWLVTGQLVFDSPSPTGLLLKHLHETPEPPSRRTELAIPPSLESIILACLEKRPEDRPQTAKELARRLAAVEGADRWTEERSREWWETHRPTVAATPE